MFQLITYCSRMHFFPHLHADAFILNQKKRTNIQKQFIKFAFIFVYLMLVASFDAFPSTQMKHINPMFYGSSAKLVIFLKKKILIFAVVECFFSVLALVWWKKVQKYTVSLFKIINLSTQMRQLWAAQHFNFRWNCHNHYFYRIFLHHCNERKYFEGVFNILLM